MKSLDLMNRSLEVGGVWCKLVVVVVCGFARGGSVASLVVVECGCGARLVVVVG